MMRPKYDVTSRPSSRVSVHIMSRVTVGMVLATLGSGCTSVGMMPPGALKSGDLRYTAYNLQGAPLLAGTLHLTVHDDSTVTGTWVIDWVAGSDTTSQVGPQVGHGTLSGSALADGTVELNLNPLYADNNVYLSAAVAAAGFSGLWSWSGFAGPLAHGRFQALF